MTPWLNRTIIAYGVLLVAPASVPRTVEAQGMQYSYRSGDTVRFIETLDVSGTSTGRGGTLNVGVSREARIALAFSAADTVRAWYDSLAMESSGPNGPRRAETQAILRAPFLLHVRGDGQVRTVAVPTMPAIVRQLAELYPQFDDFLALLPKDSIAAGAARTDTVTHRETIGDRHVAIRRVIRSRVERDTVAGTKPAVVISVRSTLRIEVTSRAPGGDFATDLLLDGTETGFAVISRTGELLQRWRTGESRGATTYSGRGTKVSVPQTYTYRAMIKAVEK